MTLAAAANHLWQSTALLALAAILVFMLRRDRAQARYAVWMAASLKFLAPLGILVSLGERSAWRAGAARGGAVSFVLDEVSRPFSRGVSAAAHSEALPVARILIAAWALGCAAVMLRWATRWIRIRAMARAAEPVEGGRERSMLRRVAGSSAVALVRSRSSMEPGVFGVFRPVLILPEGMAGRLDDAQLEAIFAHELCHVRRRDNLTAALHMMVEALFWFHPAVWWLGARLTEERELACDEEVLRRGGAPESYAEGVLKVCQFCLESPLACAAGVTGADLKKRVARIMTNAAARPLGGAKRAVLAAAAAGAIAAPVVVGVLHAPPSFAQQEAGPAEAFEAASIKPSKTGGGNHIGRFLPGGKYMAENLPVKALFSTAYHLEGYQITGGPGWLGTDGYDISARPEKSATSAETRRMLQTMLAERFHLAFHRETKEMAGLALLVGKGGFQLQPIEGDREGDGDFHMGYGHMEGQGSMGDFAGMLAMLHSVPVFDLTGLKGTYDWKLKWAPASGQAENGWQRVDPVGDLFSVLQEQVGLRVEARKGPVEVYVIDGAERPTEN